ncbi:MAG TPA: sulfatase [Anaerolineae bacterium]|nr:sulfatase [Anaerolineae bacterium]
MSRPNLLLIILDATRADACSCYGAGRLTTPCLDAVAQDGTLYEQAISAAPWTLPAFASIFTGFYPSQLGIEETRCLDPSVPNLPGLLAEDGYETFGVTGNIWLGPEFGLTRGFGRLHRLWQLFQAKEEMSRTRRLADPSEPGARSGRSGRWLTGNPFRNLANAAYGRFWSFHRDYGARRTATPFIRWLRGRRSSWFACVHYLEAHLEYRPPRAWARRFAGDWQEASRLLNQDQWRRAWRHMAGMEKLSESELRAWRDLYLAEVAYADQQMGDLIAALRASGALDNTLLAITGDHGESLGEHGLLNHQYAVHEPLLRVPLVIRYPGVFAAGQRVSGQVQTLDLFRTILDAAGTEAPSTPSRSLRPGMGHGRQVTVSEYGVPRMPDARRLRRYGLRPEQVRPLLRGLTALRTETHKIVEGTDGSLALYDLCTDPREEHDLAAEQPGKAAELQAMLTTFREQHRSVLPVEGRSAEEMDAGTLSRLRGLGYLE